MEYINFATGWKKIKNKRLKLVTLERAIRILIILVCLFFFKPQVLAVSRSEPLIADHQSVGEFAQIPNNWINQAKTNFHISYGHTSHGTQIITGLEMLALENSLYNYSSNFLCDLCIPGASDLGNPDRSAWATATRNYLNGSGSGKNMIIWSWCDQHDTSGGNITNYLNLMNDLEVDFPNVIFVYMTGHLNGDGVNGNTRARNDQIRSYCLSHNKILFDFADIERHDPNGVDYPDGNDNCGWCTSWCLSHSCPSCGSCAHSHCFNCYQKGKAFWWLMARLAGWNAAGSSPSPSIPPNPYDIAPPGGDGQVNIKDFLLVLQNWGQGSGNVADLNGNGAVDIADLLLVLQYWH